MDERESNSKARISVTLQLPKLPKCFASFRKLSHTAGVMEHEVSTRPTRWGKSAERQWPRFKVDFGIKIIAGTGTKTVVQGRAHDLSEGGLGFYAVVELQEGQLVQLEFTPPFCRRAIEVAAVVRDKHDYRYGLEFRKITQQAAEDLSRSCRALNLASE